MDTFAVMVANIVFHSGQDNNASIQGTSGRVEHGTRRLAINRMQAVFVASRLYQHMNNMSAMGTITETELEEFRHVLSK